MNESCREIRRNILRASRASGHGHMPTSFSVVEMISAVYETMRHDPKNPAWPERDVFILSKGHAALGFYNVLARYGYFAPEEIHTFGHFQTKFGCHPDRFKVPGAELSTGSLGHGIAVAVGMALGFRLSSVPRHVYVLIGDGEANEGTVWEAVMVATHLQLSNMTILYDDNRSQGRSLPIPNPGPRFAAFGCDVEEVDGHDLEAIKRALAVKSTTVRVIVCRTIKGYGCRTLIENVYEWHRKSPLPEQFEQLMKELDEEAV